MPGVSEKQRKAAGVALSAKRGKMPKSKMKGASKEMMSMSEEELRKMASHKKENEKEMKKMHKRKKKYMG